QLPAQVAGGVAREGDQVDVGRVEDQLDAHQHVHGIAAREQAEHAEREQARRQHEVVLEADTALLRRRTIMAAPISATSSSTEAASNGSRYSRRNSRPIAAVVGAGIRARPGHSVLSATAVSTT